MDYFSEDMIMLDFIELLINHIYPNKLIIETKEGEEYNVKDHNEECSGCM